MQRLFPICRTDERAEDFLYSQAHCCLGKPDISPRIDTEIRLSENVGFDQLIRNACRITMGGLTVLDGMFDMGEIARMRPPLAKNCWRMLLHGRADFFVEDIYVAEIARHTAIWLIRLIR